MSNEYAMSRVKDALDKSGGNHMKAKRLIMSLLEKDHTLLAGLAAPHIDGIISHAIAHVLTPPAKRKINPDTQEKGEFGDTMLASLSSKRVGAEPAAFGQAEPAGISKPGKASKAHVDAINALVKASKNKDKPKK